MTNMSDPNLGDAQTHPAGYPDPQRTQPAAPYDPVTHVPVETFAPTPVPAGPRVEAPEIAPKLGTAADVAAGTGNG